TEESKMRMQNAIDNLFPFTNDLFEINEVDKQLQKENIIPDIPSLKTKWKEMISDVVTRATLKMPDATTWQHSGSRNGKHSEHLSYIVGEMQSVARVYPGAQW